MTIQELTNSAKERRSIRVLEEGIVEEQVIHEVLELIRYAPSAFNMQSGRILVLEGEHHKRLWSLVAEVLRPGVLEAKWEATEEKLAGFKKGHGTFLFYEDMKVVQGLQTKFPGYAKQFPVWSDHSSGMIQYLAWLGFSVAGVGASLQHYNPLIDEAVKSHWDVEEGLLLKAQMPFGVPAETPGEKTFLPDNEVIRRYM